MSPRAAGWALFATLALTAPTPLLMAFEGLVPPVRYLILAGASVAVALVEGGAGPVLLIVAFFAVHALLYLAAAGALAWLGARLLSPLAPATRGALVAGFCAALLGCALAFELYSTPFGRAPAANLLGVLS